MATKLKTGDKVEWNTSQGKTKGVVKKKLTAPMKIKGHKVAASRTNPEYLIESSKTGEKAAHKPESLKKTTAKKKTASKKKSTTVAGAKKKPSKAGAKSTTSASSKKSKSTDKGDDESAEKEFKKLVNLTPKRLGEWLDTEESKKVGFKENGKGESVGHDSGKKIVKLLAKKKDNYTNDDLKHIHKVVGYIKRHLAQRPNGDITASNWRYSLMNWGHDPAR